MAFFNKLIQVQSGNDKKLPLLFECLLCANKFTVADTRRDYFVDTGICKKCYTKAVKTDAKVWCFGKLRTTKSPGYSQENIGCKLLCPDSAVCVKFIKRLKLKGEIQ